MMTTMMLVLLLGLVREGQGFAVGGVRRAVVMKAFDSGSFEASLRSGGWSRRRLEVLKKNEFPDLVWSSASYGYDASARTTQERVEEITGIKGGDLLKRDDAVSLGSLTRVTALVFLVMAVMIGVSQVVLTSADPELKKVVSYAFLVVPVIFTLIGSTNPGVVTQFLASDGDTLEAEKRIRRHEAGHLVAGYAVGLTVTDFDASSRQPRVEFEFDGPAQKDDNRGFFGAGPKRPRDQVEKYAVVAVAGPVAEAASFGDAKGALGDFINLQQLFDAADPPYASNADQKDATRRAVLRAFHVLGLNNRENSDFPALAPGVLDAVDDAMAQGNDLPRVLAALEQAAAVATNKHK